MNAKQYKDKYGKAACVKVAEKAGTNYVYFYQLVNGDRRPSVELAKKLVKASKGELDLLSLIDKPRKKAKKAA